MHVPTGTRINFTAKTSVYDLSGQEIAYADCIFRIERTLFLCFLCGMFFYVKQCVIEETLIKTILFLGRFGCILQFDEA